MPAPNMDIAVYDGERQCEKSASPAKRIRDECDNKGRDPAQRRGDDYAQNAKLNRALLPGAAPRRRSLASLEISTLLCAGRRTPSEPPALRACWARRVRANRLSRFARYMPFVQF